MPEKTIVLCEFSTPTEAHVALGCLQAESIPAFLTGDTPEPTSFSMFGRMPYAKIELHVDASQAQRARTILAALRETILDRDWESQAEDAIDGWICEHCDSEAAKADRLCPVCGEPRPEGD